MNEGQNSNFDYNNNNNNNNNVVMLPCLLCSTTIQCIECTESHYNYIQL